MSTKKRQSRLYNYCVLHYISSFTNHLFIIHISRYETENEGTVLYSAVRIREAYKIYKRKFLARVEYFSIIQPVDHSRSVSI